MRILLADPDRDLLTACSKTLALHGHTVITAFDGAQAIALIGEEPFELAVVSECLPRVSTRQLLTLLRQKEIPHIVLLYRPLSGRLLCQQPTACDYLPLPFLPAELAARVEQVHQMSQSGRVLTWDKLAVDEGRFCLRGTDVTLCRGEIETLDKLFAGAPAADRAMPYLTSLNIKLARIRSGVQIRCTAKKGYQLVSVNE